jgi:hypothetical protein
MKLYFAKSRTPIIDIIMLGLAPSVYWFWLGGGLLQGIFGMSMDTKQSDVSPSTFVPAMVFVLTTSLGSMIGGLYLGRYIASKVFKIKTGEGYVELDTKTNKARIFINGAEEKREE